MTPAQSHPAPGSTPGKKHPPARESPPATPRASRRGVSQGPQERPGAGSPARPSAAPPEGRSAAGVGGEGCGEGRPPASPLRPRRRGKGWGFGFRKGGDLNHQGALFLFILLVISYLLISLYLGLVSYTTVQARHVQDLRETLLQIQVDNAFLEQQIGEKQKGLFQQAVQMGFVPAAQVEIVGP